MKKPLLLLLTAILLAGSCADDDSTEIQIQHSPNTDYQIVFIQNQGLKCMDSNGEGVFRFNTANSQQIQRFSLSGNSKVIAHTAQERIIGASKLGDCFLDDIGFSEIYLAQAPEFELQKFTDLKEQVLEQVRESDKCAPFSTYSDVAVSHDGSAILAIKRTISEEGTRDIGALVSISVSTKIETELSPNTSLAADETAEVFGTEWSGASNKISGLLYVTHPNFNESRLFFSDSDGSGSFIANTNGFELEGPYVWASDEQSIFMRAKGIGSDSETLLEIGVSGEVLNTTDLQGTDIFLFHPQATDADDQFIYGNARLSNDRLQVIKLNKSTKEYTMLSDHNNSQATIVHGISPDGQWVLYSVAIIGDSGFNLWKVKTDGSESTQLTSAGNVFSAEWIQVN